MGGEVRNVEGGGVLYSVCPCPPSGRDLNFLFVIM